MKPAVRRRENLQMVSSALNDCPQKKSINESSGIYIAQIQMIVLSAWHVKNKNKIANTVIMVVQNILIHAHKTANNYKTTILILANLHLT